MISYNTLANDAYENSRYGLMVLLEEGGAR